MRIPAYQEKLIEFSKRDPRLWYTPLANWMHLIYLVPTWMSLFTYSPSCDEKQIKHSPTENCCFFDQQSI